MDIICPGYGYSVTPVGKPVLALISKPTKWVAPFTGMSPEPFKTKDGIYTMTNLVFVDITGVDESGGILDLRVNNPGFGYSTGMILKIISGSSNGDNWEEGIGNGCIVRVNSVSQWIGQGINSLREVDGFFLGQQGDINNELPTVGDLVYIPTYGWGLGELRNTENSSPFIGAFAIDYSSCEDKFGVTVSEFPPKLQRGVDGTAKYTETGTRRIVNKLISHNSQILVSETGAFQLNAPIEFLFDNLDFGMVCLQLDKPFSRSSFRNVFNLTEDYYISESRGYTGFEPENSFEFTNHSFSYPIIIPKLNSSGLNTMKYLSFDNDSVVPLNYNGTTVSQNQMVCYEIELVSLILPNQILDNKIGGLIAFYPYVYVELSNVADPSSGNKNILYSNNPNARNVLFRAAITNTPTPDISKFIKISGNGAVQTVKFKPNDYLKFKVTLSDGTLFETSRKDSAPPVAPDSEIQISAQFGIRRLVEV